MIADATAKAEQIRGEGDGERNRIFADAFNRDPDFFAFYRSMQAYEASMHRNDTRLLLKPDSEFFRYFVNPSGKTMPPTNTLQRPEPSSKPATSGAAAQTPPAPSGQPAPARPQ